MIRMIQKNKVRNNREAVEVMEMEIVASIRTGYGDEGKGSAKPKVMRKVTLVTTTRHS